MPNFPEARTLLFWNHALGSPVPRHSGLILEAEGCERYIRGLEHGERLLFFFFLRNGIARQGSWEMNDVSLLFLSEMALQGGIRQGFRV
jgi:hypothetical protein